MTYYITLLFCAITVCHSFGQNSGILHFSDGNVLHFEELVCLQTSRSVGRNGILVHRGGSLKQFSFTELSSIEIKHVGSIEPGMETAYIHNAEIEITTKQGERINDSFNHLGFVIVKYRLEESDKLKRERIYFGKARALIIQKIEFH